ncbi:DUF397 domain-containing protein [Streptomyces sp. CB04723]|nr:DUF397 domain-containing protein [Streptomyces sp. CB04723]
MVGKVVREELADGFSGVVPVRDFQRPEGAVLVFGASAWAVFVRGVR